MPSLRHRFFSGIGGILGLHPDVTPLISGGFKLTNPASVPTPAENLPFASRVIATGMWNYCFFQFYRHFAGPYWVERQYNPSDPSFIPRANSLLSVNMTHRTWYGFRGVESESFSMMDPAGAICPVVGYYSIETAIKEKGRILLPARGDLKVQQFLKDSLPQPVVVYRGERSFAVLSAAGFSHDDGVLIEIEYELENDDELIIGIRPFNPEGAALIRTMKYSAFGDGSAIVEINGESEIRAFPSADETRFSDLASGDAYFTTKSSNSAACPYGISTGALVYRGRKGRVSLLCRTFDSRLTEDRKETRKLWFLKGQEERPPKTVQTKIEKQRLKKKGRKKLSSLTVEGTSNAGEIEKSAMRWKHRLDSGSSFVCARDVWNRAAKTFAGHMLALQTGDEVTPGIYTYRQFWFRDAAYMLNALSSWNFRSETEKVLSTYGHRQEKDGFFHSHDGEWDSNGQAIWTLTTHIQRTGNLDLLYESWSAIQKGAEWIVKKRKQGPDGKILPAGFSAEHLGPSDFYYWDNFWSIAGLREASRSAQILGKGAEEKRFKKEAEAFTADLIEISKADRKKYGLMTAAPGRPEDPGMIGNICEIYPLDLEIISPADMSATVKYIHRNFFDKGMFFHPIIHSGYNVYLSIQMAQCLFRLGDVRSARKIFKKALKMRSDLWTYPEAIHPLTGGGVMGDGFHGWAYAEMLLLLREFVLSRKKKSLDLFRGLREKELYGSHLHFGPFPFEGGLVAIDGDLNASGGKLEILTHGIDRKKIDRIRVYLPGLKNRTPELTVKGGHVRFDRRRLIVDEPGDEVSLRIRF